MSEEQLTGFCFEETLGSLFNIIGRSSACSERIKGEFGMKLVGSHRKRFECYRIPLMKTLGELWHKYFANEGLND